MKQDKFLITLKHPDTEELKQYRFKTREDVCEFLEINKNQLTNLLCNRNRKRYINTQRFRDITIEKLEVHYFAKDRKTRNPEEEKLEYHRKLTSKA